MFSKIKSLWAICMTNMNIRFTIATWLLAGSALFAFAIGDMLHTGDVVAILALAFYNTWLIATGRFFRKPLPQKTSSGK